MFDARSTSDLVRIASAGGGFRLAAGARSIQDLEKIAAAAAFKRARVTFTGLQARTIDDILRIASAGNGAVIFED